jgi:serine protease AprX
MQALGVSWGDRKGRRRTVAVVAAVTAAVLPAPGLTGAPAAHKTVLEQVIVQAVPGALEKAEAAVSAAGGKVARQLHIVNGFAATVPAGTRLGTTDGVRAVTPDRAMHLQAATYAPSTDAGAPLALASTIGANTYYQNGFFGQGVGVALIDSGVVPEDGLHHNLYYGPDFTPEATDSTLRYLDTYGHGTFMAGLIAGRTDAAVRPYSDANNFAGVAPEATLVSVKVADQLGNTQESAVVAAVDWAAQHMNDGTLNIRVLNLSLGATNTGYVNDPLAAAIERAWQFGITVVSAAGNEGTSSLDIPATDPYNIAVGAVDNKNTTSTSDDSVASFSNSSSTRSPDFVAPGTHLVSLRDVGSYVDNTYNSTGAVNSALFRGSGTSQAAAVTSGAAALVISQHPGIPPDLVKSLLSSTARPLNGSAKANAGMGQLNLTAAYSTAAPAVWATGQHAAAFNNFATSSWGGSWNSSNVWQSQTPATLLSPGHQAQASSQASGSTPPWNAFDGDPASQWASMPADNQWLMVDLGNNNTAISSVNLSWGGGYAKSFQIQTSNDNYTWTTIYSTTSGTGGNQSLNVNGSGRWVRLYAQTRALSSGFSVNDMQVSGPLPQACSVTNAALNKPATSSGNENSSLTPNLAFDSNPGTRWSSAFADNQWLQVDLGVNTQLCLISLKWEWSHATAFRLESSQDGYNWTPLYSTTTGPGNYQNIPVSGWGRYVRMFGVTRSTTYGFSLYDMSVYPATGAGLTQVSEVDGGTLSGQHWTGQHWTGVAWSGQHWTGATWASSVWANRFWS